MQCGLVWVCMNGKWGGHMRNFIQSFHFLEPKYFLLLVPLTLLVGYLLYKRRSRLLKPTKAIAPHLLAQLVDKPNKAQGFGPILVITFVVTIIILVLAKQLGKWRKMLKTITLLCML